MFATDIDEDALEIARAGLYPESIVSDVAGARLRRYFNKESEAYRIGNVVRGMVVFARQDITRDPPFSRMDLISCRNLLIYLQPELQIRVLDLLSYGLKPYGFLLLGHAETLGPIGCRFETTDRQWKLYRYRPSPLVNGPRRPEATTLPGPDRLNPIRPSTRHKERVPALRGLTERYLLDTHTPACAVINESGETLYIHGHTGNFLEPAAGEANLNILNMARGDLRITLSTAIREAVARKEPVGPRRGRSGTRPDALKVDLTVEPMLPPSALQGNLIVLFEEAPPAATTEPDSPTGAGAHAARVAQLEAELRSTHEVLQGANEALESSNEELVSTVEELQSTNEELLTSQEELRSVNEELLTVNAELEQKVNELDATNDDLKNLLASTEIGTVFLDLDLRVRRFTPAIAGIIHLIDDDIGRPLAHIAHNLDYGGLLTDLEAVLSTLTTRTVEVRSKHGPWYSMKITLYRTARHAVDGVVMTFIDISQRRGAEDKFRGLVETAPDATVIVDSEGIIGLVNAQAERLFGYARAELIGNEIEMLVPERFRARHPALREAYFDDPHARPLQTTLGLWAARKGGEEFPVEVALSPLTTDGGLVVTATVRDVTARHRSERALRRSNGICQGLCRVAPLGPSAADRSSIAGAVCRDLVDEGGYRLCWVGHSVGLMPVSLGQAGVPEGAADRLATPVLELARGKQPPILANPRADSVPLELRAVSREWDFRSLLIVPITRENQSNGVLVVCDRETDAFTEQEHPLLQRLAESLSTIFGGERPAARPHTGSPP